MSSQKVSTVTYLDIQEGWDREIKFSAWLRDNLDALNEALSFNLVEAECEKSTENFYADLLAKDERLGTVVIENQYGKSDHDHLGKVLTYVSSLEADAAIWIVPYAREEHIRAIQYLNDETDQKFYLVRVSVIRVENSPAAPVFTLLVGPDDDVKARTKTRKRVEASSHDSFRFWEQFLDYIKQPDVKKGLKHQNCSPRVSSWIAGGSGISRIGFNYVIVRDLSRVELYIDRGDLEANNFIFDSLHKKKASIESRFGQPLNWQRLDERRASRISLQIEQGLSDEASWPELNKKLSDAMRKLIAAVSPELESLKSQLVQQKKEVA